MKLLVSGGRDFVDKEFIFNKLFKFHEKHNINVIINGGANGVDSISSLFADHYNIKKVVYNADWEKYGKAAGNIRNSRMLYLESPDFVMIFPGGNGTKNMENLAKNSSYSIIKYDPNITDVTESLF